MIGRTCEVWSYLLIPVIVALAVLPAAFNGDFGRLLPLDYVFPSAFARGDFWSFVIGLRGFILALSMAGMLHAKHLARPILMAGLLSHLMVGAVVVAPFVVFSEAAVKRFQFPSLEVMDTVNVAAFGVHSFLLATDIVWYVIGWVVVSSTLFASAHLFAEFLGHRTHRPVLLALTGLTLAFFIFPIPPSLQIIFMTAWSSLGLAVGVVGPWLLLAVSQLRRLRGEP